MVSYSALKNKKSTITVLFYKNNYAVIPNLFMNSCFLWASTGNFSIADFISRVVTSLIKTFGFEIPRSPNIPYIASNTSAVMLTVSLPHSLWTTTLPSFLSVVVTPGLSNTHVSNSWRIFGFLSEGSLFHAVLIFSLSIHPSGLKNPTLFIRAFVSWVKISFMIRYVIIPPISNAPGALARRNGAIPPPRTPNLARL